MTISHPPGSRLPLLSSRPVCQTFPAAKYHRPLADTKLYCLVTEAHRREQLVQGCCATFAPSTCRIRTHDLLIASPTLYPLRHRLLTARKYALFSHPIAVRALNITRFFHFHLYNKRKCMFVRSIMSKNFLCEICQNSQKWNCESISLILVNNSYFC